MTPPPDPLPLFAITAPGVEPLATAELRALGIVAAAEPGGVAWSGTRDEMFAANLWLRTASRVVLRVAEFRARTFFELERHARRVPWQRFLPAGRGAEFRVTCRKSRLYHEGAVEQRLREAVTHVAGERPFGAPAADAAEEGEGAERQLFVVRFLHDRCTVSADTSGALLHRRGYRQATARAPLRETLAAATVIGSGWTPDAPLLDPMCGSGTLPIEAALIARRIPPALATAGFRPRRFAFEEWADHEPDRWRRAVDAAREGILARATAPILGSDRDAGAVEAAHANAARAGVTDDVQFDVAPVAALEPPPGVGPGWVVANPPYGVRVGESRPLRDLYAALGNAVRERMPGWTVALLSADRALEGQLGIEWREELRTSNGGIPVRLVVGRVPG
jgi:putative N6-adenine-specific DNA methylase